MFADKLSWRSLAKGFAVYREKSVLMMFGFGFSSGLPLYLVFATLSFWLSEAGIERKEIGFISWVALAYAFKWLWAPLIDRVPIPFLTRRLGRRRGWMLLAQFGIIGGLIGMSLLDPQHSIVAITLCALLVAFSSATQDVTIDAFRIESAPEKLQAAMAAAYITGYRIAMIVSGAGALWLAAIFGHHEQQYDPHAWQLAYLCMAGVMSFGVICCFIAQEPDIDHLNPVGQGSWLYNLLLSPFIDFWQRYRWHAVLILAFISTYRIADVVMGIMANPFYHEMGYTKEQVAAVSKIFGVIMTLAGAGLGGVLVNRLGTMRILFLGALLTAATNILYSYLATQPPSTGLLTLVISADNLGAGIATAAFITYLSSLTNVVFSATQYALLSSVMLLLPKILAGFSGYFVDLIGYNLFFITTALMGLPALLLIVLLARYKPHA